MNSVTVYLNIPKTHFMRFYQGQANHVNARSSDGEKVRFPASILKPYLTHSGISGTFRIEFDENNKFTQIAKI